ncbi:uncharacterized protein LOC108666248 isoform X2 [Hyalella azteca]|uniref:Uncharacterized protein LOC108666248 isoform X2 n=1 Tax=Hyalella azteca TaxID=294128 RepID=A0A8B7N5I5_HYAAZ|nr:uncharacterized protein LOC108666248 isoform X2 [Hyalella azteca]
MKFKNKLRYQRKMTEGLFFALSLVGGCLASYKEVGGTQLMNSTAPPQVDLTNITSSLNSDVEYLGQIAYNVVAPIIIIFGLLSNIINLLVLSRPTLRGPTFRYLKWLAVANLLVCAILLPFAFHSHDTPVPYMAAFYLAHVEIPIGNALMAASVYIVVGLSIDRFVAVCYPRKYRNLYRHHVATVRIAMSFVVAFIIYIPMMVFHQRVEEAEGSRDLYLAKDRHDVRNSPLFIAYACLLELCARLAPALMLAYLNSRIIIEFKMISARRKLLSQGIGCSEVSGYPSPSANDHSLAAPQNDDNGSPQYQTTSCALQLKSMEERSGFFLYHNEDLGREGNGVDKRCFLNNQLVDEHLRDHISDKVEVCDDNINPPGLLETDLDAVQCLPPTPMHSKIAAKPMQLVNIESRFEKEHRKSMALKSYTMSSPLESETSLFKGISAVVAGGTQSPCDTARDSASHNLHLDISAPATSPSAPNSLEVGQQREGSALLLEAVIDGTAGSKCGHEAQKKTASGVDNGEAIAMISSGRCLQMSSSAIRKGERRHDRERRLVLLLVSIIVTFFVTNIPAAILSLITYKDSYRQNLGFQIFRAVANNLEFLNYGLSFLLYFLFSKDIRGVFVTLLKTAIKSIGKTLSKGRSSSGRTSANL